MLILIENTIGSECSNGPSGLESLTKRRNLAVYKFLISVYCFLCFQETLKYLLQQKLQITWVCPCQEHNENQQIHTPMPMKHQTNVRQASTFRDR
jgi:hypothetical protein